MKFSFSDIIGVGGVVLGLIVLVLDKAGKLKGPLLFVLLGIAAVMTLFIAVGNSWVLDSGRWKIWRGCLATAVVLFIYSGLLLWITESPTQSQESSEHPPEVVSEPTPSLLFVFGAPLGDNNSDTWIMLIKHYGPASAYNCTIDFYDKDRKSIEHEWLAKHPNSPFLAPGKFDRSQYRVYIPEAGPEGSAGSFQWKPLNPNSQHYTVSITCRDGAFEEKWEVTRVNGILRSRVRVERGPQWVSRHPNQNPIVFSCTDPEFSETALAINVPQFSPTTAPKAIHPGWKPSHLFEIPVAIIDPNGNVQVMSGVKQPDGSTRTSFGCWDMLTKHFGDNP